MNDSDLVGVGDELVVRIAGYPVGKAVVVEIHKSYVLVGLQHNRSMKYKLPPNFKDYDQADRVAYEATP